MLYLQDFYMSDTGQMMVESKSKIYALNDYKNFASYTKPSIVAGGQALAWVNKRKDLFHSIKICSYSEYYDDFDSKCKPCEEDGQYSTLYGQQC